MEKIEHLYNLLEQDKEFFVKFKEDFIEYFADTVKESVHFLDKTSLRSVADRIYIILFSLKGNPINELKDFVKKVAESETDIKIAFSKSFLYLLKNYIDYKIEKGYDFDSIKTLVELLDIYLSIIDFVYVDYTKKLEKQINQIKKERLSEEKEFIFYGFEKIDEEDKEIQVLDFYKEVPVICKAKIKQVLGKKIVILKMINCLYKNFYIEGNDIFIKSDVFPKVVKGVIKNSDMANFTIEVSNFKFSKLLQEERKHVRVVPKGEIPLFIIKEDKNLIGKIADISIGGIGIYIKNIIKNINSIDKNDRIKLRFELRGIGIEHTGTVKYIKKENGFYRIGIEFDHNEKVEEIISEYVVKRQFEIIKELRI